jgi:hypothetical protein
VQTGSGNITLQTHSPLVIDGTVTSTSGNITLAAGTSLRSSNVDHHRQLRQCDDRRLGHR